MRLKVLIIILIITIYMISPIGADSAYDIGVGMVSSGLESAAAKAGNDLNGGNATNFSKLSTPYNPLENPAVITVIATTAGFTLLLFLMFLLIGLVYIFFIRKRPKTYKAINYVFNDGQKFDFMWYVSALGRILVLTIFIYIIMEAVLVASWVATSMMGDTALNSVQTTNQSGYLSFVYNFLMWIVDIILIMRNIILSILFGIAEVWVILREYPPLKKSMNSLGLYYIVIATLQPILVIVTTMGFATDVWINSQAKYVNVLGVHSTTITGATMGFATEVAIIYLIIYIAHKLLKGAGTLKGG
jgi:hypothetical protein